MPTESKSSTRIPKTGRIGRFAKILEEETDQNMMATTIQDAEEYGSMNDAGKAAWWRETIRRLEESVGMEKAAKIMETCGRRCCGQTSRKRSKQLMGESQSIEQFIQKLNERGLGGGRLKLLDKNTITGGYDHCYCGQVKHTKERFPTNTYCHCSVGWYKQLFESALERPVQAEITQSIVSGAKSCEFTIHI